MKLAEWSAHPVFLNYPQHIRWASTEEDGTGYVVLRLVGDDGSVGVAEGGAKLAWNAVTPYLLTVVLEELFIPVLREVDLLDETAVNRALSRVPENRVARTMCETACWDLRSQAAGKPLWQLWGGDAEVPVSWTVTRQKPDAMAADAARMVERHGFRALKIKGGQGRDIDRAALTAIRAAVGSEVAFTVDANRGYSAAEALSYVEELAEFGVVAAEDPCQFRPNQAFRELQEASPIPLLVDNGCRSASDAALFLEHGALSLAIKLSSTGVGEAFRMAKLAMDQGAESCIGFMGETSLGALVALQVASALPDRQRCLPSETSFFLTFGSEYVNPRVEVVDGKVRLPAEPGLARWVDWERVESLRPA